ncbi:P-loop NTPase fold protein [Streptomyces sp. NPDC048644]|uniref:P-loop NTPase fold protein n=1 Tax=Streptomyces sp. NPDC048644 TaxID=3365582 RepID=UPI00371761F3
MASTAAGYTPFSLLNDEPVAEAAADLLGSGSAARRLAGLLVSSRPSTPFTLAIDAGWGMGKSSLMRLVDAELAALPEVHTVWYNAWTSTGADALEGLIKSVLMRFDRRVLRRGLQRVTDQRALLRAVRAVTTVAAGPLGVSGLVDELWKNLSVNSQARNEMRAAIGDLVQEWAQTDGHQPRRLLVVFIDDLDRCSEETVLAVCEAVKVYLDVPGLAFVVGCDRSAMGPNGLLRDLSPAGSAFMEKIFQTSYRIPAPDGQGVEEYIRWCARTAGVEPLLDDALVELLVQRTGRNPRRIKRLVNGFVLEATLNPVWRDFGPEAVIRTLLLQYFYPDFYRMMTGPSGTVDGDVVAEFRTYRTVRRTLLAAPGAVADTELTVAREFVARYDLLVPGAPDASGAEVLAALERQLPNEFPDLVTNPAFTSLVDELTARDDAARLLLRLREGPRLSGEGAGSRGNPDGPDGPDGPEGVGREWGPLWQVINGASGDDRRVRVEAASVGLIGTGEQGRPEPSVRQHSAPPPDTPYGGQQGSPGVAPYPDLPEGFRNGPTPQGGSPAYEQPEPLPPVQLPVETGLPTWVRQGRLVAYQSPGGYALPTLDVLWVDDQPDRKAEVRSVLRSLGVRVRHVTTSAAAAGELRLRTPGLLISDISRRRNHAAGFAMVQRFQEEGLYAGPVIFYTIRQSPEREDRAARLGAAITNQEDQLRELVLAVLQEQGRPQTPAPAPAPVPQQAQDPSPQHGQDPLPQPVPAAASERLASYLPPPGVRDLDLSVLWVDDEATDEYWLTAELRSRGARVHLARNDATALRLLAAHPVDLLLSDITRDGDGNAGFALARRLREERRYLGPLAFLTGFLTPERERFAEEVGAMGITNQPVVAMEWAARVAQDRPH